MALYFIYILIYDLSNGKIYLREKNGDKKEIKFE